VTAVDQSEFQCLHILNRNQTRILLSFHDVITDMIAPESAISVERTDTQHRRRLC